MDNKESIDDFLARKEQEKQQKKQYAKQFINIKVKRNLTEKIDEVINFEKENNDLNFKKGEMISKVFDFYIDTVVKNNMTEEEAKKNMISNQEARKVISKFDENNQVMLHLLLGIFQNIGLQSLGEHDKTITDFVDDLSEENGSTQLLEFIKGKISDEKHAEKLKRR